jgi:glycosyltransferase involved in cell wall biosynthesis
MALFSVIVPVYNRPEEVAELLGSLTKQTDQDFEVLIVDDGSGDACEEVVTQYDGLLTIFYFYKENTGQGFSRNYAAKHANGAWLVFFDSDCVIPTDYFQKLRRLIDENNQIDAFCGPDAAAPDFSVLQKAISYSMTSFLTTGGIRGKKHKVDREPHLRSYNLVIKKEIFEALGGFAKTNMGEDMELSFRFRKAGYQAMISEKLMVYHKRRNTLNSFFWQVFSFGRTRVQLYRSYGIPIKIPHLFPSVFTVGILVFVFLIIRKLILGQILLGLYVFYLLSICFHAAIVEKDWRVGVMAPVTAVIQHMGYELGFIYEFFTYRKN